MPFCRSRRTHVQLLMSPRRHSQVELLDGQLSTGTPHAVAQIYVFDQAPDRGSQFGGPLWLHEQTVLAIFNQLGDTAHLS